MKDKKCFYFLVEKNSKLLIDSSIQTNKMPVLIKSNNNSSCILSSSTQQQQEALELVKSLNIASKNNNYDALTSTAIKISNLVNKSHATPEQRASFRQKEIIKHLFQVLKEAVTKMTTILTFSIHVCDNDPNENNNNNKKNKIEENDNEQLPSLLLFLNHITRSLYCILSESIEQRSFYLKEVLLFMNNYDQNTNNSSNPQCLVDLLLMMMRMTTKKKNYFFGDSNVLSKLSMQRYFDSSMNNDGEPLLSWYIACYTLRIIALSIQLANGDRIKEIDDNRCCYYKKNEKFLECVTEIMKNSSFSNKCSPSRREELFSKEKARSTRLFPWSVISEFLHSIAGINDDETPSTSSSTFFSPSSCSFLW